MNIEHRTPNIERRIMMALRLFYFYTGELNNFQGLIRSRSAGACAACYSVFLIDRIHYSMLDVQSSMFDVHFFVYSFQLKPKLKRKDR